jgi:hypothetical protein
LLSHVLESSELLSAVLHLCEDIAHMAAQNSSIAIENIQLEEEKEIVGMTSFSSLSESPWLSKGKTDADFEEACVVKRVEKILNFKKEISKYSVHSKVDVHSSEDSENALVKEECCEKEASLSDLSQDLHLLKRLKPDPESPKPKPVLHQTSQPFVSNSKSISNHRDLPFSLAVQQLPIWELLQSNVTASQPQSKNRSFLLKTKNPFVLFKN